MTDPRVLTFMDNPKGRRFVAVDDMLDFLESWQNVCERVEEKHKQHKHVGRIALHSAREELAAMAAKVEYTVH